MSAINIHLEQDIDEDSEACGIPSPGLGGPRACTPSIESTHINQTYMLWARRTLFDWVRDSGVTMRVVEHPKTRRLGIELSKPFTSAVIPWAIDATAGKPQSFFGLIGMAGKMKCPTWDLPSGAPSLMGSCPGAIHGQSTIPLQIRKATAEKEEITVRLQETICQVCYAAGGKYSVFSNQLSELLKYWWTRDLIVNNKDRATWVATMVEAIRREKFPNERHRNPQTGGPLLPMRVHSSGDFFDSEYAQAWCEVANALPEVTFWAPTRTWAKAGWIDFWAKDFPRLNPTGNLIVRPSAYHTDDPAPSSTRKIIACTTGRDSRDPRVEQRPSIPWKVDVYPFNAEGTASVYKFNDLNNPKVNPDLAAMQRDAKGRIIPAIEATEEEKNAGHLPPKSVDPRYDWACRTYAIEEGKKDCQQALAPDGTIGCRACWIYPNLRVNYTVH